MRQQVRNPFKVTVSRLLLRFSFAALIAGCASLDPRIPPELKTAIPTQWSAPVTNPGEETIEGWLSTFDEPELRAIVEEALANNYDLQTTAAKVDAAVAQAKIAGAELQPFIDITPNLERRRDNVEGASGKVRRLYTTTFDLSMQLSWELDVWGRIRAGQAAAEQDLLAARTDLAFARLSLAARAAQAWFDIIAAKRQVGIAEQSLGMRRKIAELIRGRFNRGLSTGLELRLIFTDLNFNEALSATRQNELVSAKRRLEVLLGRYPNGTIQDAFDLPELPTPVPPGLPSQLVERRPDLISALSAVRSDDFRVEEARAALLPSFQLTASGGTRSRELRDLVDPEFIVWSVAGGLVQPVINGRLLRNQISQNEAFLAEEVARYRDAVLTAFREVEDALEAEEWLIEQERYLAESARQAEASQELAQLRYRGGLIQIITLLDTLRNTLNARTQHVETRRQLLNNRINLYLALGGGW